MCAQYGKGGGGDSLLVCSRQKGWVTTTHKANAEHAHTHSAPVQLMSQWHENVGAPSWSLPLCTTEPCMHVKMSQDCQHAGWGTRHRHHRGKARSACARRALSRYDYTPFTDYAPRQPKEGHSDRTCALHCTRRGSTSWSRTRSSGRLTTPADTGT